MGISHERVEPGAGSADLTAARILCYRLGLAWAGNEPGDTMLGQLKGLLSGPQLRAAGNIASVWTPTEVLNALRAKLSPEQSSVLTTLAAALNYPPHASSLDRFPIWREQSAVALDQPWLNGLLR